jgi:hypothetical protein
MARQYGVANVLRSGIAAADTVVPVAPEDTQGNPVWPAPPGVVSTDGANLVKVTVQTPTGSTGSTLLNVYAWDAGLRAWVMDGAQVTLAAATAGDFSGRLLSRTTVTNWASKFIAVLVATLATGGGAGVGTSVSVTTGIQSA